METLTQERPAEAATQKKLPNSRRIIISIAVILAVAIGAFTAGRATAPAENSKDPIVITAAKLVEDYETNARIADTRYAGRVLIVTGDVFNTSDHQFQHFTMTDYDTYLNNMFSTPFIDCNYTFTQSEAIARSVEKGDIITVKGICGGYEKNESWTFIQLFNCELVN